MQILVTGIWIKSSNLRCQSNCTFSLSGPLAQGFYRGFTLIEMLLTVFLIGLTASLVVLNVGQNADDIAKLEAKRFAALVSHLQDESTITGLPMGIEIREIDNRYSFWQLEDTWARIERQNVLRERTVPEAISLEFTLLQDDQPKNEPVENSTAGESPHLLMVDPTGLIRPFIISFIGDKMIFNISLDNELNPVLASAKK